MCVYVHLLFVVARLNVNLRLGGMSNEDIRGSRKGLTGSAFSGKY